MSKTAQTDADWRALYPFRANWADLPGGRMHYLDEHPEAAGGSDSTLLFVHGNPTWSFHWRRLIQSLRRGHRCVAVDHIGCGLSEKPRQLLRLQDHIDNLVALVESLDLKRLTLVAQDWGGAIGLGAMMRLRERLERIVLFNTGAFPPNYIPFRIAVCRWPIVGQLAVQGGNLFSRAALQMTLARNDDLEPAVAAGYLAPYDSWANRRAVYGFVKDIPAPRKPMFSDLEIDCLPDDSTWGRLAVIEQGIQSFADRPSCLIWGMRDWCFRPDCLERFVAAWPQAEVHRLEDVGHWVIEDAPEDVLAIVTQFLARTESSAASGKSPAAKSGSGAS
jgi:cis-3-alkyl-4-acyloxetan-2-one decarboxylase